MPDNTNVNNNSAVVVVGRTAPVPPGQQKSEKSIPVVVASDQSAIPVEEQNKVQSEVALSLLGIPRSEVALGIFADVNTYDINPTEWTSTPEQYATATNPGAGSTMGWGLTHVPEESGALLEAPADKSAILTSKRFFRYQPGRVSSATFGVKTTTLNDTGANIQNPAVRKYGIFDNYDGYYWETRNDGQGDNFCVVRRTQSILLGVAVTFGAGGNQQSQDYGTTNYYDPLEARGSEALGTETDIDAEVPGYKRRQLGDLVILRDRLLMTNAGVYDPTLLQPKHLVGITSVTGGNTLTCAGLAKSITNAVYNINTGLMVITTAEEHGYHNGKFLTLAGIGMTCDINPNTIKYYPNRVPGYNIVRVDSPKSFTVNVGVSTVPTNYVSGGYAVGLSTDQYVSYTKGTAASAIGGLTDTAIYKVKTVGLNTTTGLTTLTLKDCDDSDVTGITNFSGYTGIQTHCLETPVPFVQPRANRITTPTTRTKYTTIAPTGMFPYMYFDDTGASNEGYIDTSKTTTTTDLKAQIDAINTYYKKWVNQNVDIKYWGVYEYRIPRSRFSGDRLDDVDDGALLYSDAVGENKPGDPVQDPTTLEALTDESIWNLEFDKVTMYKVEFSWYGAVGALFLAYVPVSNGEARWVRVHHLRASNQLKVASLGNATLPITYLVYGGGNENRYGYNNNSRPESAFSYGSPSEHIIKYGASYYIDGGDRGTVKLFSFATPTTIDVFGSKRTPAAGTGNGQLNLSNADNATDPYIVAGSTSGFTSSYYIGSKVITNNPLDQNIEINYYNASNRRLYLNSPLNSNSNSQTLTIIPNRVTPLVGIKCRDFIQSSTGRDVRNRTQVYPTRLSTGSTGVIKVDLLKTPIFQTDSIVVNDIAPNISAETNIGKRSKPTVVDLPLTTYTGTHTFVSSSSDLANAIALSSNTSTKFAITNAAYDSATGKLTLTTSSAHSQSVGTEIRILKESLTFTCTLDNNATEHSYPRETDPIFDGNAPGGIDFNGAISGDYSRPLRLLNGTSGSTMIVSVTTDTSGNTATDVASRAEYIRDIGGGAYGYFRGYFETDSTQKPISVLGYLENRGKDRTKGIDTDGYYFYALNSTTENVVLTTATPFVREEYWTPSGGVSTGANTEQTLAQLSSVKVNQRNESPIPGTGTVVASLYIPASGEEFDLSSYFDYNKEYLSFPLTDKVDSLYVCGSSQSNYTTGTPKAEVEASLTWEEQ